MVALNSNRCNFLILTRRAHFHIPTLFARSLSLPETLAIAFFKDIPVKRIVLISVSFILLVRRMMNLPCQDVFPPPPLRVGSSDLQPRSRASCSHYRIYTIPCPSNHWIPHKGKDGYASFPTRICVCGFVLSFFFSCGFFSFVFWHVSGDKLPSLSSFEKHLLVSLL